MLKQASESDSHMTQVLELSDKEFQIIMSNMLCYNGKVEYIEY